MRPLLAGAIALLAGCGPRLEFHSPAAMTPDEMLARASHVFVGTIGRQVFENTWPFVRVGPDGGPWRLLRREVNIELVLRGAEVRQRVDVFEIAWTGGASGSWNSTAEGERNLFLVLVEDGRYHVVRDGLGLRCVFPVTSGRHERLPLDEARPMWERIALMNWWVPEGAGTRIGFPDYHYNDPGGALGQWRTAKLLRGLVRHPSRQVRVPACRELVQQGLDECWETMTVEDRDLLGDRRYSCCMGADVAAERKRLEDRGAEYWWRARGEQEARRLLTTVSNRGMRAEFCRMYAEAYPGDGENGCPADRPPPATRVTAAGDVPVD